MTKPELNALTDHIKRIEEYIKKYSDVPVKALNDYTNEDIVTLRVGYEMITGEIDIIKKVFIEGE
jgi:hypothetical protein